MPSPLPALTIFDVETTGLSAAQGHRIIEIAGIRIEDGMIDEEKSFVSLVNPERGIPWEAKQVNKISDDDVRLAPNIEDVLPKFLEFAKGSILIGHNAQFDRSFLLAEKEMCWGYIELPEIFCTMRLSRALFPGEFGHSLDAVARRLQLQIPKARHRALPDVILTAQALLKMTDMAEIKSLDNLRSLAGLEMAIR
jgi:DNA polymerase III epsilon subunit family exonuclease